MLARFGMKRVDWAILFGKFKPPHIGHQYMIDFATQIAHDVTVFVGDPFAPSDRLTAELRGHWLRQHFGNAIEVVVPPAGDMSDMDASEVMALSIQFFRERFGDRRPNLVVGADPHTHSFAQMARCPALITDTVVTRASHIREDPALHWNKMLPSARPFFLHEVWIVGGADPLERAARIAHSLDLLVVRGDSAQWPEAQIAAARRVAERTLVICLSAPQLDLAVAAMTEDRAGGTDVLIVDPAMEMPCGINLAVNAKLVDSRGEGPASERFTYRHCA
jgi:cytidyltransferase-like protein